DGRAVVADPETDDAQDLSPLGRHASSSKWRHGDGALDQLEAAMVVGPGPVSIRLVDQYLRETSLIADCLGPSSGLVEHGMDPIVLGKRDKWDPQLQGQVNRVLATTRARRETLEGIQSLLVQRDGSAIGGMVGGSRACLAKIGKGFLPHLPIVIVLSE